jgi:hypothetical protein
MNTKPSGPYEAVLLGWLKIAEMRNVGLGTSTRLRIDMNSSRRVGELEGVARLVVGMRLSSCRRKHWVAKAKGEWWAGL